RRRTAEQFCEVLHWVAALWLALWLALCRCAAEAVRFVEGAGRTARLGLAGGHRYARDPRKSPAGHQVFIQVMSLDVQVRAHVTRNIDSSDREQELRAVRRSVCPAP